MISLHGKFYLGWSLALLICILSFWCLTATAEQPIKIADTVIDIKKLEIGKQIYLTGLLASGETSKAIAAGDSPVSGDQFTCVSCHRRSRLGTSEGGKQVPSVTATALFNPSQVSVTRGVLPKAFKYSGNTRIPYTDESLAKVIREGVDPSGRKLDPLMPRYALDDENIAALTAYLKKEPSATISGVDELTLHFATVVTDDVDPAKRKAMLDILTGYFQDKNANTRHNTKRAKFSAYKMYQVYRKWELHVWELKGKESTWPEQLENYYRTQPVLAMVSGLSASGWQPIHQFCEQFEVACLFPNTNVPVISQSDFYTVYFSKGVTLEAETIASHLQNTLSKEKNQSVIQVFRDKGDGVVAAKALHDVLQNNHFLNLQDVILSGKQELTTAFWDETFNKSGIATVILWLDQRDLATLEKVKSLPTGIRAVYGSLNLTEDKLPQFSNELKEKLFLIYPWELPDTRVDKLIRVKSWLKSKQISFEDERLQANTFFSVQVLAEIIMHLLDNFSSAYIVERIEGMLASLTSNSIYPNLSLGAGQRFASKGSYIVKISPDGHLLPVKEGWIVP
jgi:hypothetical protein